MLQPLAQDCAVAAREVDHASAAAPCWLRIAFCGARQFCVRRAGQWEESEAAGWHPALTQPLLLLLGTKPWGLL